MARGVSKATVRPPPQAWLANCLHAAKVVTVSGPYKPPPPSKPSEAKASKETAAKKEAGVKRPRGESAETKFRTTERDGYGWLQCDSCQKWRYAPETCVTDKWTVRAARIARRVVRPIVVFVARATRIKPNRLATIRPSARPGQA